MKLYYLRLSDQTPPGLDPTQHVPWEKIRAILDEQGVPFLELDTGDAHSLACKNTQITGTSDVMYVRQKTQWGVFPIKPSVVFRNALLRGVAIKLFLSRYYKGVCGSWRIVALVARPKAEAKHSFKGKPYRLTAKAYNDSGFLDNEILKAAVEREVVSRNPNKQKRLYTRILVPDKLPLPKVI